jgi:hypothetical protein
MDESKLIGSSVLYEGKWLRMIGKQYDLGEGKQKVWEMAERTTKLGPVDGAEVLATFID